MTQACIAPSVGTGLPTGLWRNTCQPAGCAHVRQRHLLKWHSAREAGTIAEKMTTTTTTTTTAWEIPGRRRWCPPPPSPKLRHRGGASSTATSARRRSSILIGGGASKSEGTSCAREGVKVLNLRRNLGRSFRRSDGPRSPPNGERCVIYDPIWPSLLEGGSDRKGGGWLSQCACAALWPRRPRRKVIINSLVHAMSPPSPSLINQAAALRLCRLCRRCDDGLGVRPAILGSSRATGAKHSARGRLWRPSGGIDSSRASWPTWKSKEKGKGKKRGGEGKEVHCGGIGGAADATRTVSCCAGKLRGESFPPQVSRPSFPPASAAAPAGGKELAPLKGRESFPVKTDLPPPYPADQDADPTGRSPAGSHGLSSPPPPPPPQIGRRLSLLIPTVSLGIGALLCQLSIPPASDAADVASAVIDLSKEPTASMFDPSADPRLRDAADIFGQAMSASTVKEEERLWTVIIDRYGDLETDWTPDILSRAWGNRGNARSRQGKLNEALEDYTKSIQLAPYAIDPVLNRGVVLESLGRYEEAAMDYKAVLDADPRDPAAWNNLGNVMGALGKWDDAVVDYKTAWQLAPEFSFAAANYGLALYEVGQKAAAIRQFRSLLRRYPEFPDVRAALAVSLYADGLTGEAETNWGRMERMAEKVQK
ncbi:hypothetical protein CBR_g23280 [Chara braunii]|uniref:Uncharacterized protein n=1 Tax=Chara braunii TaxID=69332 RepID=A0A388JVD6_CHABU|nr:hypothetical protein CBR_g23280 [Chara braunii]|eukprot:GBG61766.1 hypothetical protein CBR_g23280 [Chara braunii]